MRVLSRNETGALRQRAERHGPCDRTLRNDAGAMTINIFRTTTSGTYTYKVVRAKGSEISFKGTRGEVVITQNPTTRLPYYVSGQATMTFNPG
jgi:hypothetical protein